MPNRRIEHFIIDILWYHNLKLLESSDNILMERNVEQMKATLRILNVTKDHVGFYQCKAVNDVNEDYTKAKLELASASSSQNTNVTTSATATDTATAQSTVKGTSKTRAEKKTKTNKKLVQTQRTTKQEQADEVNETNLIVRREASHGKTIDEKQRISSANTIHVVTRSQHTEDADVEILEETEEIHVKIYKEAYSAEEIENFKIADEVNSILETIQAHQFGSGEQPLRELATVAHLLKKGVEITEIIQLYDADFFPALKLPESQSALVQLVERQGYENLIAEILNTESIQDEHMLASTVGFRAFMRLVEVTKNSIEELITSFKFEDFVSQEWKHKEVKENEYVEVTESRVSSIRAEKITVVGNEFD